MSSTSMDHLDELRVATASSLPLNGLAPAPTQGTTPRSRPSPVNAASLRIARGPPELIAHPGEPRARRMTATPAPSGSASLSESLNRVQR